MGFSRQYAGHRPQGQFWDGARQPSKSVSRGFGEMELAQDNGRLAPHRFGNPVSSEGLAIQREKRKKKADDLRRKGFSSTTRRRVQLKHGEHRRHIISHHTMMNGLKSWRRAQRGQGGLSTLELQAMLDRMNNHTSNLIPGRGDVNSAIGMISHQVESSDFEGSTPQDIHSSLSRPRGFQQQTQRELMEGVLEPFQRDPTISSSPSEAEEFAKDIGDSTDFDWPGGTQQEFQEWSRMRQRFIDLQENPGSLDAAGVQNLHDDFLRLSRPSGDHYN